MICHVFRRKVLGVKLTFRALALPASEQAAPMRIRMKFKLNKSKGPVEGRSACVQEVMNFCYIPCTMPRLTCCP